MPIPPHVAPRLKIDRARAKANVRAELPDVTDAEVDAALATLNQDAIYDEQRAPWTVEVWDRVSPINGAPASHFLERGDVPDDGDVYLLVRDGAVVGFQPHEPEAEGIVTIPKGKGLERGKAHADVIAADNAAAEVLARVRAHIATKRAAGRP